MCVGVTFEIYNPQNIYPHFFGHHTNVSVCWRQYLSYTGDIHAVVVLSLSYVFCHYLLPVYTHYKLRGVFWLAVLSQHALYNIVFDMLHRLLIVLLFFFKERYFSNWFTSLLPLTFPDPPNSVIQRQP